METFGIDKRVYRGGADGFDGSKRPSSFRDTYWLPNVSPANCGFRVTLYL